MLKIKEILFSGSFLMLLLLAATQVSAQVSSRSMSMSQGVHDGLILELPSADDRMVENLWTAFVKDNFDNRNKENRRSKEMEALNISIPGVSVGSRVDMYSVVNELGDGAELVVWIASNDGYVSPVNMPDRYVEAEKMLLRFAIDVAQAQLDEEIETQEKELRDMERELTRMDNEQERSRRAIERARQTIEDEERNIEQNEAEQEAKRLQMEEQRQLIQTTREKKAGMRSGSRRR
ncbi:MAG: hypothetical protein AAF433_11680 [Bacteroidota bacterium]